ncbi:MAG: oxidoreductase, partial [Hyphomicrobiales bacterium]|nr:oxidoreductase [Hyphomicrobiales bacterium]
VGARLTDDLPQGMYNYGHIQVTFADGSVGWFEAGWGPMMSETAFFIKDAIGPNGSVSIVVDEGGADLPSSDLNTYTRTNLIRRHHAALTDDGLFARSDERLSTRDEPSHDDLCEREQRFLLSAIDEDVDLADHMNDAIKSLAIVLAADESIRTGKVVQL